MLQRDGALKNSGHQRNVTDNGRKKRNARRKFKNHEMQNCGDAYRISCNAIIIIITPTVMIIVHWGFSSFSINCHSDGYTQLIECVWNKWMVGENDTRPRSIEN